MNSKDQIYSLDCGGKEVTFSFVHPETHKLFGTYLNKTENSHADIAMSPEIIRKRDWIVMEEVDAPYLEFYASMVETGNYLLAYNRALFHSVSFIWNNLAWLVTAPSGTGKTTQLKHWGRLCGKAVSVINGDKSVLECRDDGTVYVHSAPWTGKEGIGFPGKKAKLGGIILLEQGGTNEIHRIYPEDSVLPLFYEFISYPQSVAQLESQGKILDCMLKSVPVWKLINLGDRASAELTIKTLRDYLRNKHDESEIS